MENLEERIARAEQWLFEHGGLPLVDSTALFKETWPVEDPSIWEDDSFEDPFSSLPIVDHTNPAARFVLLNHLWQWRSMPCFSPEGEKRMDEAVGEMLVKEVGEHAARDCRDPDLCQWEIVLAAHLGLWDRVDDLYSVWRRKWPESAATAALALARVKAVSVLIRESDWVVESWLNYPHDVRSSDPKWASVLKYLTMAVGGSSSARLQWTRPKELTPIELQRVYEASELFQRLQAEGSALDDLSLCLSAWSDAVIGERTSSKERLLRSASAFQRVTLPGADVGVPLTREVWPAALLLTQLRLAAWAMDFETAVTAAEELVNVTPQDPWAWELLAQIQRKLGNDEAWIEAYEEFIRLNPHTHDDWERTELLRLGLAHRERVRLTDLIAAVPALRSDIEVTEALLAVEWPEFNSLGPEARERWLTALTHLSNPRVAAAHGGLRWAIAAEAAGEAVASQLRHVVVEPIRAFLPTTGRQQELERDKAHGQLARSVRLGTMPMGSILLLLEVARNRSGELGPLVNGWLERHGGSWGKFVRDPTVLTRLDALTQVRNPATHGSMSSIEERQALDAYAKARTFLTELVRAQLVR